MLPIKRKKLGLLVSQPDGVEHLSAALAERNWPVVASIVLADEGAHIECLREAEVLVADLSDADENALQHFNDLIAHEPRPVLFNDAAHDKDWLLHLISKLEELPEDNRHVVSDDMVPSTVESESQNLVNEHQSDQFIDDSCADIWLISASLGGPKVLRDLFLAVLPELPVCFLVTQRIALEHIDTLVNYLGRYSRYEVSVLADSTAWAKGKIIVVPDGYSFTFDADGNIGVSESEDYNGNELDRNITELARRYGQHAGVMVLSAVSDQGVKGCEQILIEGGRVWLHDDLPRHFNQIAASDDEDDRVIIGSAAALAERINTLYRD